MRQQEESSRLDTWKLLDETTANETVKNSGLALASCGDCCGYITLGDLRKENNGVPALENGELKYNQQKTP